MADTDRDDTTAPRTGQAEATGTAAAEHITRRWLVAVCTALLVALVVAALVVGLTDNDETQVPLDTPESSSAVLGSTPTAPG